MWACKIAMMCWTVCDRLTMYCLHIPDGRPQSPNLKSRDVQTEVVLSDASQLP